MPRGVGDRIGCQWQRSRGGYTIRPILSRNRGLMNKQQSVAPSSWHPRLWSGPPPLQGPPRGCRARAPPLSARCSAEGAQVRTGPAPATRAAVAADPGLGQTQSQSPGQHGVAPRAVQSRERGSQGRARRAPCAPVGTRCPARGEQGQLRARWARRAGLGGLAALLAPTQPLGSAPANGPLCWRSLQG